MVFDEFTRLGETGNFVVLSFVCLVFGVYAAGLVFARRADKKDYFEVFFQQVFCFAKLAVWRTTSYLFFSMY